jgi:hypothetical protein
VVPAENGKWREEKQIEVREVCDRRAMPVYPGAGLRLLPLTVALTVPALQPLALTTEDGRSGGDQFGVSEWKELANAAAWQRSKPGVMTSWHRVVCVSP